MKHFIPAGIKEKALLTVFVFVSVFYASFCQAYSYCNDSYPRARIIQNLDGSSTYTFTAIGSGFSSYEIQKNSGVFVSGGFASGQTISGSFMSSSSSKEYVYFKIRNANGKVINGCETRIALLKQSQRPACGSGGGQVFLGGEMGMSNRTVWGANSYSYFGGPSCYTGAPAVLNYVSTSNRYGVIFSGPVTIGQSVYVAYNAPYFKYPADMDAFGCYDSLNWSYTNWVFNRGGGGMSANEPPVNASFQIIPPAEGMIAGKNIQFNASAAKIYSRVPDDYIWKLDGVDYRQGEDKSVIFANFPVAGTHTMSLTIREGRGNSGSSTQTFTLAPPPPPPTCNADFNAPASAYYNENVSFDPSPSSNTGEANVVYTWSKSDGTLLGVSNSITPFQFSFGNVYGPSVDVKLNVQHNTTGANCTSPVHRVNLSNRPPSCDANFSVSCPGGDCNYDEPITFQSSQAGAVSYSWTADGSNIGSGQTPSYTFTGAVTHNYRVVLVVDVGMGVTCTSARNVRLSPMTPCATNIRVQCPKLRIQGGAYHCTYGDQVKFFADTVSGVPSNYKWSLDNPVNVFSNSDRTSQIFWYLGGASHTIYLESTDAGGGSCGNSSVAVHMVLGPAGWNEIAPNVTSLGSMLFLIFLKILSWL